MSQSQALLFDIPPSPTLSVSGLEACFPVHRIFCVGRNYAAHAAEMGHEVDREAPFYFTKSTRAIVLSGATIPYPPGTSNFHHEMEFVVALGKPAFQVSEEDAMDAVFGYACGLDMTRRDLQQMAREKGRPWDLGKNFEQSAVIGEITPKGAFGEIAGQEILLDIDGEIKQRASLSDLIWSVPQLISHLSHFYHIQPGDLLYTGTPAGVGPVTAGAKLTGRIEGLTPIELTVSPATA